MPLVEMLGVLAGDNVDLGVPIHVERIELGQMRALLVGQVGEIMENTFNLHKGEDRNKLARRPRARDNFAFTLPRGMSSSEAISS